MKINHHNYEEYFILYADNELGSDERRMVDDFVSANPGLKDELDIYLNAVLLPDTKIGFADKKELLRYDESLLSYLDDELNETGKAELEKLITDLPVLQTELEFYRKTKLQPDTTIIFENKSVLYRSTEKRRVIPMTFIRWSVAAAVLLAVSITAVTVYNTKTNGTGLATNEPGAEKLPAANTGNNNYAGLTKEDPKNKSAVLADSNLVQQQSVVEKQSQQNNLAQADNKKKNILPNDKKRELIIKPEEKRPEIAINNQQPPSNNLPSPQNNPYLNQKPEDAFAVNDTKKGNQVVTTPEPDPLDTKKQADGDPIAEPQFASLTNMEEDGGQNKKSRGFFRKLTRVFEKNTGIKATTDDDKLHIAAFTVKLK